MLSNPHHSPNRMTGLEARTCAAANQEGTTELLLCPPQPLGHSPLCHTHSLICAGAELGAEEPEEKAVTSALLRQSDR